MGDERSEDPVELVWSLQVDGVPAVRDDAHHGGRNRYLHHEGWPNARRVLVAIEDERGQPELCHLIFQ